MTGTEAALAAMQKDENAIHDLEEHREYYTSKLEATCYESLHSSKL